MTFLDQDRKIQREERRKKWRERRKAIVDRLAKITGLFAGSMFGTSYIGFVITFFVVIAGAILVWRLL